MHIRFLKTISLIAAAVMISTVSAKAEGISATWRKSMTNDPVTNYDLAQALKPLDNKDAETLRIFKLAVTLGTMCVGAKIDRKVATAFKANTGYSKITGKAYDDAAFLADDRFRYFDYRRLAHLCAGSSYLFGPQGHLVPKLIKGGKAKPAFPYNPNSPYIMLEPLRK